MSSGSEFKTKSELHTAVDLWISDEASATTTYGDINEWDVSAISDFSVLFEDKSTFNSDISSWDVSSGTNFSSMFEGASWRLGC